MADKSKKEQPILDKDGNMKLHHPFTDESNATRTSIHLRRPTVGDMLEADKEKGGVAEKEIYMFSTLTGLTTATIKLIDLADYQRLQTAYSDFLS